jgi:hypothetical protein
MSGIALKIADAAFARYVERAVPYFDEAAGYWLLGKDADTSRMNLKTGTLGTIVGAPTFGDADCAVSKDNGIETDVVFDQDENKTIIVVATPASTGYCGTWHSSKTHALLQTPGSTLSLVRAQMVGSGVVDVTADAAPYRFMAATFDNAAAQQVVYGAVGGAMLSNMDSRGPFAIDATNAFRIGAQAVAQTGVSKAAAAMAFRRVLLAAEIEEVYEYLKFKLGRRGVTLS